MANNEASETPDRQDGATAPFELEQVDAYGRYFLHSPTDIQSVFRSLLQKGAMITVHFDHGQSFFLTSVIELLPDHKGFVIDIGSNDEMNLKARSARKLIFTTTVDKVKVQFRLDALTPIVHQGRPAFQSVMPTQVLRLQRREYFRLTTPVATPIRLCATVEAENGPEAIDLPLFDISIGGVGLIAPPQQARLLQKGSTLADCRLLLPGEGLLVTHLCIRGLQDFTTRSGARHVRVGCEFVNLPAARLSAVQRYITRVERERKARLNGLA